MRGVTTRTVLRALGVALFALGLVLLTVPGGPAFTVLLVGLVLVVLSFVVPARSS
jgi:hypothetical protein